VWQKKGADKQTTPNNKKGEAAHTTFVS
jgi:hypothetical protein